MNLLNKLLWKGKAKWQVLGAAIGAFIGLLLLLTAVQLYFDLQKLMGGEANPNDRFVQINKRVNIFNMLMKSTFSKEEMDTLKMQPFINDIGTFTSNQFKANATSRSMGFYTELFFESVPDKFLDIKEPRFRWRSGQKELPIILSRDYLALYNFGFAPSQGLPQFTPLTIKKVTFDVNVSGNGLRKTFEGRIVGFSDRINSVLVPASFMEWANNAFGRGETETASRLILKVENPLAKNLQDFLKNKGYEVTAGKLIGGQFGVLLNLVVAAIAGIGFLLFLLSVLIFVLNFQLIISRASEDIRLLLQLGYKTKQISRVLTRNVAVLYGIVIGSTLVVLFLLRILMVNWMETQGFHLSVGISALTWLLIVGFSFAFLTINFKNIEKNVVSLF